jgi:hypothetical protein
MVYREKLVQQESNLSFILGPLQIHSNIRNVSEERRRVCWDCAVNITSACALIANRAWSTSSLIILRTD